MVDEGNIHAVFWSKLELTAQALIFPSVFDTPSDVQKELSTILEKIEVLSNRWEEFVILFPDIHASAVPRMAEKIRKEVEKSRPDDIFVTISIGVTQGQVKKSSQNSFLSWISKADKHLYKAKSNGRNCVVDDCSKRISLCQTNQTS